jgi:hypothetical protein
LLTKIHIVGAGSELIPLTPHSPSKNYSSSGPWILRNRNPKLKPTKIKLEDKIAALKISPAMTEILLIVVM